MLGKSIKLDVKLLELGADNERLTISLAKHGYKITRIEYSEILVENGAHCAREARLMN